MDYKECTLEELANWVEESPCSRITQALTYHVKHGNEEVAEKIKNARKLVKKRKMIKALAEM